MGKVKNNKKKQARHNATGMQTNAEIAEAESLQAVPMETILPLIAKVLKPNFSSFFLRPDYQFQRRVRLQIGSYSRI